MPKGRKPKKSIPEQIEEIKSDIQRYQEAIITLTSKLEDLERQKREEDLIELYEIIQNNNLSIDDVKNLIEPTNEEENSLEKEIAS